MYSSASRACNYAETEVFYCPLMISCQKYLTSYIFIILYCCIGLIANGDDVK